MRVNLFFVILALSFALFLPVSADESVTAVYGETYYCGDSFEVSLVSEPEFTSAITRSPGGSILQLRAGEYDTLVKVRVQIRNLTTSVFRGLSPESIQLIGYVRGRPISYSPEIMEPYDYGGRGSYRMYDKMYYRDADFLPLRKFDMLLVYRINPILRDLELHFNPSPSKEADHEYLDAVYEERDLEPCDGILRITTIRNAETGEITKYYR